jgi:tetratricopeptide (TPR) repeat protein
MNQSHEVEIGDGSDRDRTLHLLRAGTGLLRQGKSEEALPFLEEAFRLDPDNPDVALNLSGAYILQSKFRKAVHLLEQLSEETPDNPMVWTNLGAAYLGNRALAVSKHQMKAVEAFKRALELDPVAPNVAYNIGLIYKDRDETEKAIQWFRKALQANPRDEDAKMLISQLEAGDEE